MPNLGRSYVDLERGIFYRKPIGKRRHQEAPDASTITPAAARSHAALEGPQIDRQMLLLNSTASRSRRSKRASRRAVGLAGLTGKVTPHTLRHTAATWLMQRGVPMWEAAGFLRMSAEVLLGTYGHHHPDYPPRRGKCHWHPSTGFRWLNRWLALKSDSGTEAKSLMITWSEWQDSNLRPLRPERSALPG